jgi:hypothetical protein
MRISIVRTRVAVHVLLFFSVALAYSWASAATQNRPPTISGSPPSSVSVGELYSFRPSVNDPDTARRRLRFSISNKPYWASFSRRSGTLQGKPSYPGKWGNIRIAVSDGYSYRMLPAFGIAVTGAGGGSSPPTTPPTDPPTNPPANSAPTIAGAPANSIRVGSAYTFTPTARDADGDTLAFSIQNRPSWATFSTATGRLSGTPTSAHAGTYSDIRISVSDGRASASLAAFAIGVSESADGAATLSWTPPTANADGSVLRNLAGYRIIYGTSASSLNRTIELNNPGLSSYVIEGLSPATYYFAVSAYSSTGAESTRSNVASKTVR